MGLIRNLLRRSRWVRELEAERDRLRTEAARPRTWVPPGHYYSPIPSAEELRPREHELFGPPPTTLPGIDLREAQQLALLQELAPFYPELPFPRSKAQGQRYWFDNPSYSYADAIFLYGMLRRLRPRRVIEIGCGWSSAAMLDTAERFLGDAVEFTFVEPYPDTLRGLLRPGERIELLERKLQDVPLERFDALQATDVLFVDSTHVAKAGSDVNRIVFEILPRLRPGVHVHFHDVFYPFEYPKPWVYDERGWNEDYFLRAFLQYNSAYEIALFGTYLIRFHRDWFKQHMPLCLDNPGGALWIRRAG
jgi:predicted O-methyltransferase YrrM